VVPRSDATWAIETFVTEVSSVIRNCADASSASTVAAAARTAGVADKDGPVRPG